MRKREKERSGGGGEEVDIIISFIYKKKHVSIYIAILLKIEITHK